jgi:hypothetical protein
MKKLFTETTQIDRGLIRRAVESAARLFGYDYETAHQRMTNRLNIMGWHNPDIKPSQLVETKPVESKPVVVEAEVIEDELPF